MGVVRTYTYMYKKRKRYSVAEYVRVPVHMIHSLGYYATTHEASVPINGCPLTSSVEETAQAHQYNSTDKHFVDLKSQTANKS